MGASSEFSAFLAKFDPAVAKQARAALAGIRVQVPGAVELVYDNYNALVVGFGASERASDAFLSIAIFPQWVTLCFFPGVGLPDPNKLLKGSGSTVRNVRLVDGLTVNAPAIKALIAAARRRAKRPIDPVARRRMVIKSISTRQRPRRPAARAVAKPARA